MDSESDWTKTAREVFMVLLIISSLIASIILTGTLVFSFIGFIIVYFAKEGVNGFKKSEDLQGKKQDEVYFKLSLGGTKSL